MERYFVACVNLGGGTLPFLMIRFFLFFSFYPECRVSQDCHERVC